MGGEALTLEGLTVRLGGALILDAVDLTVAPGSFTALLGPSGCGKTTLLRSIAGFAPVAGGDIRIGARSIVALPAERRDTAMVFQSYALWPHMSVGGNLAYPLKVRRVPRAERDRRVADILERLDLAGFAGRAVSSLSGGQRQRVALGRALIIDPPILLLDEPLSNLDAGIRRALRTELRQLQRQVGITTIMVTHDQEEALSMADQVVLMRAGHIVQAAAPDALYSGPADVEAARFLGVDNILPATGADAAIVGRQADGVLIGFRSQDADVVAGQAGSDGAFIRGGTVEDCAYVGGGHQVQLRADGHLLTAMAARPVAPGTAATLHVPAAALMTFDAASTRLTRDNIQERELAS